MTKKSKFAINPDTIRIILIVIGSIFSTLVLAFSILAINEIQANHLDSASRYLLFIFIVLALSRLVTFFIERTKLSFIRFLTLFIFNAVLGIIVMFARQNPYFYQLVGGLYFTTIIISRVFKLIQNHSRRSIILNSLIILAAILLSVGLFISKENDTIASPAVTVTCTVIAISAFFEVISNAATHMRAKVLFKIVVRTYALEIILGLVTLMVGSSIILMICEKDTIKSFWDGLYHCFATVTTIGFGDFPMVTPIGRAITVILGIYGIVVVAVITSIIVNFYNETTGKKDIDEFKEIEEETKNKKKKE